MAPLAHLLADVYAAAVGQHEVEQHGIRGAVGEGVERLFLGAGGVDLVTRVAENHTQAADDLRLAVDDQDARPVGHATRSGWATAGKLTAKAAPSRPRDCRAMRPPFASMKPRQMANPSPEPCWA